MANILSEAGSSIGNFSWASMGQVVFIITIFLAVLIIFGGIAFLMWWRSYHINVKIYEPYGQIKEEDIKDQSKIKKLVDNIKFDMIKYRKTHGKYVSIKGTPYFCTFMPFRKHEPIPMERMYDNGVHLLRLSREIYIPIEKPKTIIEVGGNVSLSVAETNQWQTWNNMMADRINNKYQDTDFQKKAITYFVIGITAMVLLGGFILWLIYSSSNRGWEAADKFNAVADSLVGGSKPM